jgi:hypothetical protein
LLDGASLFWGLGDGVLFLSIWKRAVGLWGNVLGFLGYVGLEL